MAKRLKKLRILEVSAVDHAANPGAQMVLMKRAGRRYDFDEAGTLRRVNKVSKADRIAAARAEIAENRAFVKAIAPFVGDHPMDTVTDIAKAAIAKVDGRIDAIIAKSDKPISREVAVLRLANSQDPRDVEAWQLHKQFAIVAPAEAAEPAPIAVSPAYEKMQKKAAKLAKKEGISQASAFAKIYAQRPDLVAADKAHHVAKGFGNAA